MIEELVLENFRGFRSLHLQGLKPVNLIVGHNNTGKTSLLEGFLLLCQVGRGGELPGLFRANQGNPGLRYFPWLVRDGALDRRAGLKCKEGNAETSLLLMTSDALNKGIPAGFSGPIGQLGLLHVLAGPGQRNLTCRVVSVQHRDPNSIVALIGKAYRRRGGEETFQRILATVDSRIKKVRIDPGDDGNQVVVDIGLSELLPLSQAGQGVYRLAAILADIIGEQPSVLLIDEIENGLHHSVQKQVWMGLAEVAKELNVQIFATTHSGECLHAAHRAFLERQTYDLGVVQLFRVDEGVQGRLLDREHIEAAIA
ncbi:MAG: AAA family ATPase, partial [Verrucomicrobia bacterium]|nr:AAA family ATPase [Verrucomicrobiota bacterium]